MTKSLKMFMKVFVCVFLAISLIFILGFEISVHNARDNIRKLNDNTEAVYRSNYRHVLHGNIIFYNSECNHCRQVIPYDYVLSHLAGRHPRYFDVNDPINSDIYNGHVPDVVHFHTFTTPEDVQFTPSARPLKMTPLIITDIEGYLTLVIVLSTLISLGYMSSRRKYLLTKETKEWYEQGMLNLKKRFTVHPVKTEHKNKKQPK